MVGARKSIPELGISPARSVTLLRAQSICGASFPAPWDRIGDSFIHHERDAGRARAGSWSRGSRVAGASQIWRILSYPDTMFRFQYLDCRWLAGLDETRGRGDIPVCVSGPPGLRPEAGHQRPGLKLKCILNIAGGRRGKFHHTRGRPEFAIDTRWGLPKVRADALGSGT